MSRVVASYLLLIVLGGCAPKSEDVSSRRVAVPGDESPAGRDASPSRAATVPPQRIPMH